MHDHTPTTTLERYVTALRREFHMHPETGLQEHWTADRIEEELDRLSILHERVGDTGVLGIITGTGTGNGTVVLRADIDALPIQETADTEYSSRTEGVMHACGHDAHTACLLGAARLLMDQQDSFGGEVRLIFQPAEEIGEGAKAFVEAGALRGADRVFGIHVANDLPSGSIGLKPGINNAAVDYFEVSIEGRSAHIARPHLGADAVYIASQTVEALKSIPGRMVAPTEPVLIGIGRMTAGTAYNVIAASALLEGTTRTISIHTRDDVRKWVTETAKKTAELYGGRAEVTWKDLAPPVYNHYVACREAEKIAQHLDLTITKTRPLSMGGDNFGEFQLAVPGVYAYLGTADPAKPETLHPSHSGKFDIDEDVLEKGARMYAEYARYALDPDGPVQKRHAT